MAVAGRGRNLSAGAPARGPGRSLEHRPRAPPPPAAGAWASEALPAPPAVVWAEPSAERLGLVPAHTRDTLVQFQVSAITLLGPRFCEPGAARFSKVESPATVS